MISYLGDVALDNRMNVNDYFKMIWKKAAVAYLKELSYNLCSRTRGNLEAPEDCWFLCSDSKSGVMNTKQECPSFSNITEEQDFSFQKQFFILDRMF